MNHASMRQTPYGDKPTPIIVSPSNPTIDSCQTEIFVGAETRSIARVTYDRPRSLVAYAYWDPYKNNPGTGQASMVFTPGGEPILAIGRIKIGIGQTLFEVNFDLCWGQFVEIPVSAEQVELTARLYNPFVIAPASAIDIRAFNDPPALVFPAGDTLPNPDPSVYPNGFVAISGGIAEGSATRTGGIPATRSIVGAGLAAAGTQFWPVAWGARRIMITGDGAYTVEFFTATGPALLTCPMNQSVIVPPSTFGIKVHNTTGGALNPYTIAWELGV